MIKVVEKRTDCYGEFNVYKKSGGVAQKMECGVLKVGTSSTGYCVLWGNTTKGRWLGVLENGKESIEFKFSLVCCLRDLVLGGEGRLGG